MNTTKYLKDQRHSSCLNFHVYWNTLCNNKWFSSEAYTGPSLPLVSLGFLGHNGCWGPLLTNSCVRPWFCYSCKVAHFPGLPRHLVERAFKEHLDTLSEINLNIDATRRLYILACVDDIKKTSGCFIPSVKHLHDICRNYGSKASSAYQKVRTLLGEICLFWN